MGWLMNLVLTLQVLSAIGIIVLVLLQQGKGADMGAAFGSGTSGSLFGATGSSNFLSRTTAVLATVFFIATLALSYLATQARQPAGAGSV
ncbi:MAG: preprotein translocase subunit SecG, partial [Betaproteobacteria bacterium]|nr:preprotein translocase subunit SecG [Betaproteobacteria bacterium]